jgi:DNA-binding response OmpR family regulator
MDYTPLDLPEDADTLFDDAPPGSSWTRFPAPQRATSGTLRYRGLALDLTTGDAVLRERVISLANGERALLSALMRRAGQIVSIARLAEMMDRPVAEVEPAAQTLMTTLTQAGSSALPRRVEGLGYILWR